MASQLHASQKRKGKSIPYVSNLLAVFSLVLKHDGSEGQAIAKYIAAEVIVTVVGIGSSR